MTRDDIIAMAREAGLFHFHDSEGHCDGITDARLVTEEKDRDDDRLVEMLAPFATLIYERVWKDAGIAATRTVLDAAVLEEREACAKVCDHGAEQMLHAYKREGAARCATAIRARSNT